MAKTVEMDECPREDREVVIAERLMKLVVGVTTRLEADVVDLESRLSPIAREQQDLASVPSDVAEVWPPLFRDLREYMWALERVARRMEDLLDRLEV